MGKDIALIAREMHSSVKKPAVVSHKDPFRVLISTILSQRTKDANTEKAASQLFGSFSNVRALAHAPIKEIEKRIKPAGFYHTKAKRLKSASRQLLREFNGAVPKNREQLMGLEGVGAKTAACVLVYGFGIPAIPVDVHVHRISNRIGIVKTKIPEQTEEQLMRVVPRRYWMDLNHLMVSYGQQICLPRKPRCETCKLQGQCDYFRERK